MQLRINITDATIKWKRDSRNDKIPRIQTKRKMNVSKQVCSTETCEIEISIKEIATSFVLQLRLNTEPLVAATQITQIYHSN